MNRSQLQTSIRAACASLCLVLSACEDHGQRPEARPMQVVRVFPDAGEDGVARLFLNSEITIFFDQPIDPLTVSSDTVRVVDENGHLVPGELDPRSRSVTFRPKPPLRPNLDDGSFRPDRAYRLEIDGLPLWNAVRSESGQHLEGGYQLDFRTVPADPTPLGFATPFLPVESVSAPFSILIGDLHLAADSGVMQLQFNQPVLPSSLRPDFIEVIALTDAPSVEEMPRLVPRTVRLLGESGSSELHFGSTVEVEFDPGEIDPTVLYMAVLSQGDDGLRDYLDRPLVPESAVPLRVEVGDRFGLLAWGGTEPWRLARRSSGDGIEFAVTTGRLEPLCLVEAGDGSLGSFRPQSSMTIVAGKPFDRGDGTVIGAGLDLAFDRIEIPSGVDVTIRSTEPIVLRSLGSIDIRGRLILDTPLSTHRWQPNATFSFESLVRLAGCTLVAGGDVRVSGAIEHVRESEPGSPLALLVGGDLDPRGRLPAQIVLNVDRAIFGAIESPIQIRESVTTPGVPPGLSLVAESWTDWRRVSADQAGEVEIELEEPRGAISVEVQTAPAHSVDPSRPDVATHRLRQPSPVYDPIRLQAGSFVRFRIRATVRPGAEIPSLRAIRVVARG